MIRLGLIGSGGMARVYADRTAALENARVTAVASPNTAGEFVARHVPTATAYPNIEAVCADADVDAVAILTPTHTHRAIIGVAADHGLDVICEKPLARTLDEANAIADAVADAGITFMTAHVLRFSPEYAAAKERVAAGDIGTPGVVRAQRAFGFEGARGWFGDTSKSGGVLLDLAIHDFDYLRWVFGDVERVFTRVRSWGTENESESSVTLLRFENGVVGHVEASWVRVPTVPFTTSFEFAGDDGLIEFANDDVRPVELYGSERVHVPRDPVGDDLPLTEDGYHRQLAHFLDCVATGTEPAISVSDGTEAVRLSLAAIESAERGAPVTVSEVKP